MAREAMQWSQKDLAGETKLTQAAISRLEAGQRKNPSADTLLRLAKAFGLTVEQLLGEE